MSTEFLNERGFFGVYRRKTVNNCGKVQVRFKPTNEFILYVINRNHIHLSRSTLSEE